jgi:hypothetical protein
MTFEISSPRINSTSIPKIIFLAIILSHAFHVGASSAESKSSTKTRDSKVETQCDIAAPAEEVWELIAGFDTLSDYHASVVSSEVKKGGLIRYLALSPEAGGGVVVERMVSFDDEARTFSYRIIELIGCPLPFRNYQAFVHLESTGPNSCRLYWNSQFDVEGATLEEAEELARVIYQGCYDGIKSTLGVP